MPRTILGLALTAALMLPLPAAAQQAPIEDTIRAQLDAFLADDFARAFTYASPGIQGMFGTPEVFGQMVRQGYPMVHRPAQTRMMALREVAGTLWQRVLITDAEGSGHMLDYQMVETPEGWRINAVHYVAQADLGA